MDTQQKKLAITIGDTAGVGAEVILKWATENPHLHDVVEVIAHKDFLDKLPNSISKVKVGSDDYKAIAGSPDEEGAKIAFDALELSAKGCQDGKYRAVVTAPISKFQMKKVGFDFAGQTEFFADRWGGTPVMAFAGKKLLLSLVTWHEPLRDVPNSIDEAK